MVAASLLADARHNHIRIEALPKNCRPIPFYGSLISSFTHDSPARLSVDDFFMCVIEPEFAVTIAHDLPSRMESYNRDEIIEAVSSILPAIEIVDSRYKEWTTVGPFSLIADNACAGAWIKGKCYEVWNHIDLAIHAVELVELYVNDNLVRTGRGDVVMGHPINALTWLAMNFRKKMKVYTQETLSQPVLLAKFAMRKRAITLLPNLVRSVKWRFSFNCYHTAKE